MARFSDIMGLNAREQYISQLNSPEAFTLADDKIYSREILAQHNIPVPAIHALISDRFQAKNFDFEKLPKSFVIKPSQGSRGRGILVLKRYKKGVYQKPDRTFVTHRQIIKQCISILEGYHSLSATDTVIIEEILEVSSDFSDICTIGLPDIRVIVVNLVPLMAMLRLPTLESEGKANLHAGALCFGIDMRTGRLFHGISNEGEITLDAKLRNFVIPEWDRILEVAAECQEASRIGYVGADITLDKNIGPVVIELNAQPGLGIQNANDAPLRKRLERVRHIKVKNVQEGVKLAKELFGQRYDEMYYVKQDKILGLYESAQIISSLGTVRNVVTKISLNNNITQIDAELAQRMGYAAQKKQFPFEMFLKGQKKTIKAKIAAFDDQPYDVLLGLRDIQNYVIRPDIRTKPSSLNEKEQEAIPLKELDKKICEIDQQLYLISGLRPLNVEEEKKKFFDTNSYNPKFKYTPSKAPLVQLKKQLRTMTFNDSSLGVLLQNKQIEVLKKIEILQTIGTSQFHSAAQALYGSSLELDDEILIKEAEDFNYDTTYNDDKKLLSTTEIVKACETLFKQYDLKDWKVIVKDKMTSDFSAGKHGKIFVKSTAKIDATSLRSTLAHEIETHVLTAVNGKQQPYQIFVQGFANYLTTQEGLAIYNQTIVEKSEIKFQRIARDLQLLKISETGSFRDVFNAALKYTDDPEIAFERTLRSKRGMGDTSRPGSFTKRLVYYHGYKAVKEYIDADGDVNFLYLGKISLEDKGLIEGVGNLVHKVLQPNLSY